MNTTELIVARNILMMSQVECALLIANVQPRSWQRWEKGERAIPEDVELKIKELLAQRNKIISNFKKPKKITTLTLTRVDELDIDQRLDLICKQSAYAELYARYPDFVTLVTE